MRMSKSICLGVAVGVATATLASCGSRGSAGSSDGDIIVGFIGTTQSPVFEFPETADAVNAHIAAVNAAGGVNGKKLDFLACNDKADPNEATACARRVASSKAVAVLGGVSGAGDAVTSALKSLGIVYTGQRVVSPGESRSSISFPLVPGSSITAVGLGIYAVKELNCQRPYLFTNDIPPSQAVAKAVKLGLQYASGKNADVPESVLAPPVSDYAPAASSAAARRADCVFLAMTPQEIPKAVPAVRSSLPKAQILAPAGSVPQQSIDSMGKAAEGMILTDSTIPLSSTGNPVLDQFRKEMDKYASKAAQTGNALSSWYATKVLVDDVLSKLDGAVDSASVLKAYNKLGKVDGGGVQGDLDFQSPSPVADEPRQFNRTYIVVRVKNGKQALPPSSKFADATPALELMSGP